MIAAKDEPYSTSRRSPRWYQTRCGISWTSGWAPVAIEERQTGVSDGNTEVPRRYVPFSVQEAQRRELVERALEEPGREPVDHDQRELVGHQSVAREDAQPLVPAVGARGAAVHPSTGSVTAST